GVSLAKHRFSLPCLLRHSQLYWCGILVDVYSNGWMNDRLKHGGDAAMSVALAPIEIFCSYARKDKSLMEGLKAHLSGLQHQGRISLWSDRQIKVGTNWEQAVDAHLETASLVLLLVSADFVASKYCSHVEMQRAMQRHEAGVARVIPILVR